MNIYRAQELKDALLAPLQPGVTLHLDLSAVSDFDTVGLQLLMLAQRTAQKQQGALRLVQPSAVVQDVLEVLHLASYFGEAIA